MSLITVIVPVYNVGPYLCRCVDSILAQTFTDFELILVDDGSPDNCGVLCDEYAEKDARIHVIHQPNGGLSAARNAGIDWAFANSDSEWLSFIDSDDWVHPQYLEYLYRAVKENNVKISVCEYEETDALRPMDGEVGYEAQTVDGIVFFTSKKNVVATVAVVKLYQKELFSEIRYPVGRIHEDEFITYKLLYRAEKIAYVKEQLYFYFINPQGITKNGYNLKRLDAVEALEEQCQFFKKVHKRKYYEKWVVKLVTSLYPSHIRLLKEIGEIKTSEYLRRRGRKLAVKHMGVIRRLETETKDYILWVYYPRLNRLVMPICNLSRMLSQGGIQEAVQYYMRKFNN